MNETRSDFLVFDSELLEEREYWIQKLTAPVQGPGLRTDYSRSQGFPDEMEPFAFEIDESLYARLIKLTKGGPFLLYTALLSAFKVCLYKYTWSDWIVTGSPARLPEDGSGPMVNALAIADRLDDGLSFRELLLNVRQTLLDAYAKQRYPYHRLVKDLGLDGVENSRPLFEVALALKEIHCEPPHVGNYITFIFDRKSERITGTVLFNRNLFKRRSVERLAIHFKAVLSQAVENVTLPLRDLTICTEEEKLRLLSGHDEVGGADPGLNDCIQYLFEKQAARNPHATAVSSSQSTITYGELNRRANQLARLLRERGVGPESLVGICLPRGAESVMAMLATLKAGGAYLPLDPSYPSRRLSFMLEDSKAALVITHRDMIDRLAGAAQERIYLDQEADRIGRHGEENPPHTVLPQNLAYAIYTSGTTGTPKAVAIPHAGLTNLIEWHVREYGVGPDDRATILTSQGFDAAVWELWPYLAAGASVYIVDDELMGTSARLIRFIVEEGITFSFMPTPLAEALISEPWPKRKTLKGLLTGGDRLRRRPSHEQELRLINHYGPTENTVVATKGEVNGAGGLGMPGIGRSISNVGAYALDRMRRLVGEGAPGELYLGGAGLARGYLRQAALTAERFVPDDLSGAAGSRLYRTGDLVRTEETGEIEFLGRVDQQAKIRGFRVEPQEVEAVLLDHPRTHEAAVLAMEDEGRSGGRLVAYVALKSGAATGREELNSYLKERLPEHMLPSALVILPFLPLSPNGKIDRRALPPPDDGRQGQARKYVAPRTDVEKALSEIWAQVLGVEQVGIDDNFFELGGDSILSIQVIARAGQKNIHFTNKQLFLHKTIGELAKAVGGARVVEAEQGKVVGSVPLTPAQRWFFEQEIADPHHWNQSMLLDLRHPLNPAALKLAIEHLTLHHDALRLRFNSTDHGWEQTASDAADDQILSHLNLRGLGAGEREREMRETADRLQAALNLSIGPLLRAAYFDGAGDEPDKLLMIIHHLVMDGVSWRILLEDLNTAYHQAANGAAITLPAKTTSFKYWSERLAAESQSGRISAESDFWLRQSVLEDERLPLDFKDGQNLAGSARGVHLTLSVEETRALLQDVPSTYGGEIMAALLAALVEAIGWWTGRRRLNLTLEGHGREEVFEEVDLSRTVGWFTTIYPARLDLGSAQTVEQSIRIAAEQLQAIPNRGINYGVLRYLSRDDAMQESLRAISPPQVSFNYFGQLDQIFNPGSIFDPGAGSRPDHMGDMGETGMAGQSAKGHRAHLLDVACHVVEGRLELELIYSENLHRRATIEKLGQEFIARLRRMISRGRELSERGYAPAAFANTDLSEEEIQLVLNQIE